MKKLNLYLWVAFAGVVMFFSSCEKEEKQTKEVKISFEDVVLNENGYQNNFPDGLNLSDVNFYNYQDEFSWEGFAVSNNSDRETEGYGNQYSVFANGGANASQKFAVAYNGFNETTNCRLPEGQAFRFKGLWINNATVTALSIKNGDGFAKKFEEGDWFKIIITAFDATGNKAGEKEFYLADFRNGKTFTCADWTFVDLSALGKVNKFEFTFDSTDKGDWGMNTPQYACIDDIIYYAE